jgi:DNA polymerase III epsilon subunit-like protein
VHVIGSDAAFAHFGIEPAPEDRHTALGDARATRALLDALLGLMR